MQKKKRCGKKQKLSYRLKTRNYFESLYLYYNSPEFIETDPICFAHRYSNPRDREFVAYLSATFAFGNVKAIQAFLNSFFQKLGPSPTTMLYTLSNKQIQSLCKGRYYRFVGERDFTALVQSLRELYRDQASIGAIVEKTYRKSFNLQKSFQEFQLGLKQKTKHSSYGWNYCFPDTSSGIAKRSHMFLRWMLRKDNIDLGLWSFCGPDQLLMPVDTHIFQLCRELKVVSSKSITQKSFEQISSYFRELRPEDPTRYDFALSRLGILRLKKDFLLEARGLDQG